MSISIFLKKEFEKFAKAIVMLIVVAVTAQIYGYLQNKHIARIKETNVIPKNLMQNYDLNTVKRVIDGDTFLLQNGTRVRLIGIDAPEMNYKEGEPECKAFEAKLLLKELIENKKVILKKDKSDKDKYGRLLRYVYLPNGLFVNEELVKRGLAKVKYYKPDTSKYSQLKQSENTARKNMLGIWSKECR